MTPPAATSTSSSARATGATAAEVAEGFALHPNVARHHLEKLAGGGYLDVELARHESAGRPSKRYRASADDSHLAFPPRRDDLLATLLARALERLPVEEAARSPKRSASSTDARWPRAWSPPKVTVR